MKGGGEGWVCFTESGGLRHLSVDISPPPKRTLSRTAADQPPSPRPPPPPQRSVTCPVVSSGFFLALRHGPGTADSDDRAAWGGALAAQGTAAGLLPARPPHTHPSLSLLFQVLAFIVNSGLSTEPGRGLLNAGRCGAVMPAVI